MADLTLSSGLAVLVSFRLKSGMLEKFSRLVLANARASLVEELGCLQFDVMSPDGPDDEVILHEVSASREAIAFPPMTSPYAAFSEKSADSVLEKTVIVGPRMDGTLS
jgi:quinol monooxygenase YgiN